MRVLKGNPSPACMATSGPILPGPEGGHKSTRTVRFSRQNWQHHLPRQLAEVNQAVCAEHLNVKRMLKNRKLSRAVSDVGWSGLLAKPDWKLRDLGGYLVRIDRSCPSTQTCSCCGHQNKSLTLKKPALVLPRMRGQT